MSSTLRAFSQMQREFARAAREMERANRRQIREQEAARRREVAAMKAAERAQAQTEREQKRLFQELRRAECDVANAELAVRVSDIESILNATLTVDDHIDLNKLRREWNPHPFYPGELGQPKEAPQWSQFEPPAPSGLSKLFGKKKYAAECDEARKRFEHARSVHQSEEERREIALVQAEASHAERQQAMKAEIDDHNQKLDELIKSLGRSEPEAIVAYFSMVMGNSVYPEGFPQHFRLAYVPESKHLVCEYNLPTVDVIPRIRQYKYVKSRDEMQELARSARDIKSLYSSLISQITLRTLHELFEADRNTFIEAITFNGMLETIDPRIGRMTRSCVVSLRVTQYAFGQLDLAHVDPAACLASLNANVSKHPEELVAVRPVVEFDMVDRRFVDETDILSELDHRPNLLDLSPTEFESLIQNLFGKMGLDTKQTRASRDGGIDCVAFDSRPIFGGKVVIQAKRYKNRVDVSAVRDLYGSMQNEGATKGILVTTSGYGPTAFEFAQGKPLELIDGSNLLYLLHEHANIDARILLD